MSVCTHSYVTRLFSRPFLCASGVAIAFGPIPVPSPESALIGKNFEVIVLRDFFLWTNCSRSCLIVSFLESNGLNSTSVGPRQSFSFIGSSNWVSSLTLVARSLSTLNAWQNLSISLPPRTKRKSLRSSVKQGYRFYVEFTRMHSSDDQYRCSGINVDHQCERDPNTWDRYA
jgi:hypothetical protein